MKKYKYWSLSLWLVLSSISVLASCANDDKPSGKQPTIERITERGKLLVGTTGDYRPTVASATSMISTD